MNANKFRGSQDMTKYREILRLNSLGISKISIAESCECSRKTVRTIIARASETGI